MYEKEEGPVKYRDAENPQHTSATALSPIIAFYLPTFKWAAIYIERENKKNMLQN